MYSLIVKHKDKNIVHKVLNEDKIPKLGNSLDLYGMVNIFKEYIGLDILGYRLDEYSVNSDSFTIYIRTEDLEELRNNKLNNLGI